MLPAQGRAKGNRKRWRHLGAEQSRHERERVCRESGVGRGLGRTLEPAFTMAALAAEHLPCEGNAKQDSKAR
jgi:hypothetical protein